MTITETISVIAEGKKIKRGIFINECMNLNNEYCYIRPEEQVKLLHLYNAHFTGFFLHSVHARTTHS